MAGCSGSVGPRPPPRQSSQPQGPGDGENRLKVIKLGSMGGKKKHRKDLY